ncbi:MAG TPA: GatB/YqeY domain-containing protein [Patescibacteria group bacterium]|nr:GatB/YqeY domain-containing protein [Patescibacteria group bacterium]
MGMVIVDTLRLDLNQALKRKDEPKVSTLRLFLSALNYKKIEVQRELTDQDILSVIQKEVKKRKESIEQFGLGKREDLVAKEKKELEILQTYLPQQLTDEALNALIDQAVQETNATTLAQMGVVMKHVMAKAKGQADGKLVSELVKKRLS